MNHIEGTFKVFNVNGWNFKKKKSCYFCFACLAASKLDQNSSCLAIAVNLTQLNLCSNRILAYCL